jgi:hypothetical protein
MCPVSRHVICLTFVAHFFPAQKWEGFFLRCSSYCLVLCVPCPSYNRFCIVGIFVYSKCESTQKGFKCVCCLLLACAPKQKHTLLFLQFQPQSQNKQRKQLRAPISKAHKSVSGLNEVDTRTLRLVCPTTKTTHVRFSTNGGKPASLPASYDCLPKA